MKRRSPRYTEIKTLPSGRDVYIYDEDGIAARKNLKDKKIAKIKKSIKEIVEVVSNDIKSGSDEAIVVGLILCTYERVGNDQSADNGHFGASNLEKRHVEVSHDKIILRYIGKSAVNQEKVISDPLIVKSISERIKRKKSTDRIFDCTAKQVNDYLSQFGITSKDIRTFAANKFMTAALASAGSAETKTARSKIFKENLDIVAGIIGHKPATLKSMYLSDKVKSEYLDNGKVKRI